MKERIIEYINNNLKSIIILSLCIACGLVIGIFTYNVLGKNISSQILDAMKNTLEHTKDVNFQGINIIKNGITSNLLLCILIYFAAITLIAPMMICILNFVKGFAIGIYMPTLFAIFGFKYGIVVTVLITIIPNIVYLPAYVYISINAINLHYIFLDTDKSSNKMGSIIGYVYKFIIGFSVICLSVVVEQFLSSAVISIYGSLV